MGCKGRILSPDRYCPCLERHLPPVQTKKSGFGIRVSDIVLWPDYDGVAAPEQSTETVYGPDQIELRLKLKKYGLKEHEVDLLVARFEDEKTFDEIVKEQGWTSKGSLAWHLKQVLRTLKERNYE